MVFDQYRFRSTILTLMRVFPSRHRGSQLYFHITKYVLKRRREDTFGGPKVKVEFRHLFRFKNGLVIVLPIKLMQISMFFVDWLVYSGITLVFKFQAVWTTSYHTQFRFIRTKYQGEFSLVEGFKLAFLRGIIYSSCQKIFLKCWLPIFPDWLRQGKKIF